MTEKQPIQATTGPAATKIEAEERKFDPAKFTPKLYCGDWSERYVERVFPELDKDTKELVRWAARASFQAAVNIVAAYAKGADAREKYENADKAFDAQLDEAKKEMNELLEEGSDFFPYRGSSDD